MRIFAFLILCFLSAGMAVLQAVDSPSPYVIHYLNEDIEAGLPGLTSGWDNINHHSHAFNASGYLALVLTDGGWDWGQEPAVYVTPTEVALVMRSPQGEWRNFGWPDELDGGRFALANILDVENDRIDVDLVLADPTSVVLTFFDDGAEHATVVPMDEGGVITWHYGNVLLGLPEVPMTIWGADWGGPMLAGMRWDDPLRGILVDTTEEAVLVNVTLNYDATAYAASEDHGFFVDSVSSREGVTVIAGFIVAGTFFDAEGGLLPDIEENIAAFDPFFAVLDENHTGTALFPAVPETVSWTVGGETLTVTNLDLEIDRAHAVPEGLLLEIEYQDEVEDIYLSASFLYPLVAGALGDPVRLGDGLDVEARGATSTGILYGQYRDHTGGDGMSTGLRIDISDHTAPELVFGEALLPAGYTDWNVFMSGTRDGSVILTNWGGALAVERAEVSISADGGTILEQGGDSITLTLQRHDTAMLELRVELLIPDGITVTPQDWIASLGEGVYAITFPPSWQVAAGKERTIVLSYGSGHGDRDIQIVSPPSDVSWSALYGYQPQASNDTVSVTLEAIEPTPVLSVADEFTNQSPVEVTITFSESVYAFDPGDDTKVAVTNGTIANYAVEPDQLGEIFTFDVTPVGEGEVTVQVLAGATTNAADIPSVASSLLTFVYDITPPDKPLQPVLDVESDSGVKGDNITNVTTPVITGNEVEAYATARLFVDDVHVGSYVTGADGSYTFTLATLAAGDYSLHVVAVDRAGNSSVASDALTLTIKTSTDAPTLALHPNSDSGVYDDDGVTGVQALTVVGTAEANVSVTLLVVETGSEDTATVDGDGNWSITLTTPLEDDGDYTLRITATDVAANSAQAEITITLDIQQPTLSHADEGVMVELAPSFGLSASEALYGLASEVLTMVDAADQPVAFDVTGAAGATEFTVTATALPSVAGLVTLTVVTPTSVTDLAGNWLTGDTVFTLYYDADPVLVTITPNEAVRSTATEVTVTITFDTSVTGFVAGDITVDNGTVVAESLATDDNTVFTVTIDLSASDDGPVTVSVAAAAATADPGGNLSRDASEVVATVDRSGPVLTADLITITGQAPAGATAMALVDVGGAEIVLSGSESLTFNAATGAFTLIVAASRDELRLRASDGGTNTTTTVVTIGTLQELVEEAN